ncbi:hypothetical protein DP939_42785 [Spongiactinospora rosea]|uniref:Uncharacterized protein n=1 Tax=Spongiactinospora rosea TaxID=2248750 RepID=A0A366LKQ1_9ACTN|nr:hypothetical protein [Spongiactinospora rosea]RBQ14009.1 hypothetical protein DP939_42785 [Spongiactinospora rosea]
MARKHNLLLAAALAVAIIPAAGVHAATTTAAAPALVDPFVLQVGGTLPALPGAAVSLATGPGGVIAAAHAKGLAVWTAGAWKEVAAGAAHRVAWRGGDLAALTARGLLIASGDRWRTTTMRLPHGVDPAKALLAGGRDLVLAQGDRLYHNDRGHAWRPDRLPGHAVAIARSAKSGTIAVATATGLYERAGRDWKQVSATPAIGHLAYDSKDRLWYAAASGVGVRDGGAWKAYGPADGLPLLGFTALTPGADGDVWLGTASGAIRFDGTNWEYRQGRRWLPGDAVAAIAVDAQANAYFATSGGVGRIEARRTTLAEKADVYERAIAAMHKRTPYGFVEGVDLPTPGDLSKWVQGSSDNDGLWTAMYGAAEVFRYGASKDPAAKDNARKVFEALKFLGDVTQGGTNPAPPGFIARSIIETTATDPNLRDNEQRDRDKQKGDAYWKILVPRWPKSADGKWYWKTDTSSDELVGHYFFNALYHDVAAKDDAEKREVASVITRTTDHLIAGDFYFLDHDRKPTRWGFFNPKELNGNPWRREERGLNSQTILAFLAIAEHVSGDPKYAAAKKRLIDEHGYDMNTLAPKVTPGVGGGNQSDDEMAFMNYYHLLAYEKDAELKRSWARSLYDYWQLEQYELNPFFNFIAATRLADQTWLDAYGPFPLDMPGPWLEQSVDTLKRFPLNMIDWKQSNTARLDIVNLGRHIRPDADPTKLGMRRNGLVVPIDERVIGHWNHDPYKLEQGGSGTHVNDGTSYLLPYWMGRYHKFIAEK